MLNSLHDRPPAVQQHKLAQIGPRLALSRQQFLQTIGQGLGLEIDREHILQHFKLRVQPRLDGELPQQRGAESVDGADLSCFQPAQMACPTFRFVLVGGIVQVTNNGIANTPAHLPGGTVGKGDGDDLADIDAVVAQVPEIAFGENMGLAATSARGEHDGGGAMGNGCLLLLC